MGISIDDLKSKARQHKGFAKPNVFQVILPSFGIAEFGSDNISLFCTEVTMPGRQITTREKTIGPVTQPMAYGYLTQEISMTFRLMNDYGVRKYFEFWQNKAFNQQTKEVGFKHEYAKSVRIRQLKHGTDLPVYQSQSIADLSLGIFNFNVSINTSTDVVHECTLIDAFPNTMNGIAFSDASTDAVSDLNVSLTYTNWETTRTI